MTRWSARQAISDLHQQLITQGEHLMATLQDLEVRLAASDAAATAKQAEVRTALDALQAQIANQIDVIPQSVLDSVDALTIKITAIPSA